jgi:radical SAM protein with 4Fe4S-binding SPASM domain
MLPTDPPKSSASSWHEPSPRPATAPPDPSAAPKPYYAVWEITLACTLACAHCGSRAGKKRPRELTTDEALRVVRQLAGLGVEECSLIGGEVYLREDWDVILRALTENGIRASVVTGGRGLTRERARRAKAAGVTSVSVSVDGLEATHDILRAWPGSYRAAMQALDFLRDEGVRITANTQVCRLNYGELDELLTRLLDRGIRAWQVQITAALGRAADWPLMLFQPYDVLDYVPKLAALKQRCNAAGVSLSPGNSVGYFGPYETVLRSDERGPAHWEGCGAGSATIGIESDGTFKGCPSLQTDDYTAGNLLEQSAEEIWRTSPSLQKLRSVTREDLWGFCRECYYADVCKAGCTFTAHALFGRPGNMPYCFHRAETLRQRGVREVLVPVAKAPGRPFDYGRFELHEEAFPETDLRLEDRREQILGKPGTVPRV